MPIRTSRGRAAVYRTLWGWPLRSPVHLVAAVALAAALGWLLALALAVPSGSGTASVAGPSSTTQEADPLDPRAASAARPDAPRAPAAALSVADAWVRAFLTTPEGITTAQWTEQLRPYSTDDTLAELQTVDPANVPDGQVTGFPRTVSARIGSAEVDVPSSVAVVRLRLVTTASGWRVAGFEQAG
ncbi:MAG TPA: hypothetical protein VE709_05275 [Pseudonocardiaceae bacterium]|nr:hypothetical protein [Pseudonocardiaceae bacterium]